MKYKITYDVLQRLKSKGYTILLGIEMFIATGGGKVKEFLFTPVEWDVEEFKKCAKIEDYNRHLFFLIDDLLKIDLRQLYKHRVVVV